MMNFKVGDIIVDHLGYVDRITSIDLEVPEGCILIKNVHSPYGTVPFGITMNLRSFQAQRYSLCPEWEKKLNLDAEVKEWLV